MTSYQVLRTPHLLSEPLQLFLRTDSGQDFQRASGLFPTTWKTYVMGGFPRDLLLKEIRGMDLKPADIDLVIQGAGSMNEIKECLGASYVSANTFGGAKCRFRLAGPSFDIWRIEDHTNMSAEPRPHTVEQLLHHNLLDVDAVLWDPGDGSLHDCGCRDAIAAGCIALMGKQGISLQFRSAQVAHALLQAFKTGFQITGELSRFIADAYQDSTRAEVLNVIMRKLPQAIDAIESSWKDIIRGGIRPCPTPAGATLR